MNTSSCSKIVLCWLVIIRCFSYRWKSDEQGAIVTDKTSNKKILQFVAIVRRDHGVWAIPGVRMMFLNTLEQVSTELPTAH